MPEPIKAWLVQDIVAPYRIKLFEKIAQAPAIDFRLILLSKGMPNLPHWRFEAETLPFTAERMTGLSLNISYSRQININPRFFYRLLKDRPDVVVCAGYSFATMQALVYKFITGNGYVIWMEGTAITEGDRRPKFLRRWQRRMLTRNAGALVDAGTESHKYLRSLLEGVEAPPFFTSYNAVDNEALELRVRQFREDGTAFAAFKARFAPKNILFVGQLIERKGIVQLLDAYRIVRQRSPQPIGLIVLGHGPLDDYLRRVKADEALDHLYLQGFIGQDHYHQYLAVADLMVLPSIFDPNPLVVFEGMAVGKPIVLSYRAGNAADFVEEGENGFVIDPMNAADMAGKIIEILDSTPADIARMGARSRRLVKKANYEASTQAFVDAIRSVAGHRK